MFPSSGNRERHDAPPLGEGPLVPLLSAGDDPADPVTRAMWHEAISVSVLPEVPHELFGFWLYPASGGAVLLGPEALAADQLAVPEPPLVSAHQLGLLEEVVRDAGYRSTTAVAATVDGQDVGLLLFAALRPDQHGARERAAAQLTADALAPSLARLARRWRAGEGARPERTASEAHALLAAAGEAAITADSPIALRERMSAALLPVLVHERLELLVPGASLDQWYRIGEHAGGALWSDPDLVVPRSQLDLAALLGTRDTFLFSGLPGEPVAFPAVAGAPAMRSVIGVRLVVAGRTVGVLLVGSAAERRFLEEDATLLRQAAAAVAVRLDAFLLAGHLGVLRSHVATEKRAPGRLTRVLETLATVADAAEAMRRVQSEAASLLPFDEMWIALKLGDEQRVAMVAPGETRALPDLPQVAVGESQLGSVLRGERPAAIVDQTGRTELIVPLRVGGRVIGALVLAARDEGMFAGADEDTARALADALAPAVELQRRAAVGPAPLPGWKRSPRQP